MKGETNTIDINSAEIDELTSLPGIGQNTAEKIIAARPFSSIDELLEISGIGNTLFERLAPLIYAGPTGIEAEGMDSEPPADDHPTSSLLPAPELQPPVESGLQVAQQDSLQPENIEINSRESTPDQVQEAPPTPQDRETVPAGYQAKNGMIPDLPEQPVDAPPPQTMSPAVEAPVTAAGSGRKSPPDSDNKIYGVSLTCGTLAILISIALTLGILLVINNSLQYVRPSDLNDIEHKYSELSTQSSSLARDIQTLTARLDNLETIAGRVGAVESEMEAVRSEIEGMATDLESLNNQIAEYDQRISGLEQATDRFSSFLEGLRELLGNLSLPVNPEN